MKGFTRDGKFHPITDYKGVRKSRDQNVKQEGVLLKTTSMKQFLDRGRYLGDEIKRRAEKGSPHFFDKDTMRFFSSRLSELMWSEGELKDYQKSNIYFITSEADKGTVKHAGSARAFTVRIIDVDGDINALGKFQGFSTLGEARRAIKDAIR
ncbi:MAG: hypothetical protein KJI69_03800 [Patescibacteria group bacterium]|nr:hypothetical protein [Patescibacteria group bacterium]